MRSFWLSFVNPEGPPGQRFLGVCVIDLTDEIVRQSARHLISEDRSPAGAPTWAACKLAGELGLNPGGQVITIELHAGHPGLNAPRGRLMNKAELKELNLL